MQRSVLFLVFFPLAVSQMTLLLNKTARLSESEKRGRKMSKACESHFWVKRKNYFPYLLQLIVYLLLFATD